MKTSPLISIVVPVYNVEPYLEQCLQSIIAQTYSNIEIIVVNDCSTDNSWSIIEKYKNLDNRIITINCETNGGYGKAVNTGIEKATGEWLGIVESDDFIAPSMYEELASNISHTEASIIRGGYYLFWGSGRSKKIKREKSLDSLTATSKEIDIITNQNVYYIKPSIWSAIYRISYLRKKELKIIETPGASYQDITFFTETLFETDKIFLINKPLYYYRQDNINSSINSREKVYVIFDCCRYLIKILKQKDYEKFKLLSYPIYNSFLTHYLYNFYRIYNKDRINYMKEWKKDIQNMVEDGFNYRLLNDYKKKQFEYIYKKSPKQATIYMMTSYVFEPIAKSLNYFNNFFKTTKLNYIKRSGK